MLTISTTRNYDEELAAAFENEFMQPYIIEGNFYRYEDEYGGTNWTAFADVAKEEAANPEDITLEHGFLAYLSAPGYMDRTEPALYSTYEEAAQALLDEIDG